MVKVERSTVTDAPVDRVWSVLRDFNGHDRWHPAVKESRIEERRLRTLVGEDIYVRGFASIRRHLAA